MAMLKANKPVNIGDHIPYVICTPETTPATPNSAGSADATSPGTTATPANDTPSKNANGKDSFSIRAKHPDEVIRHPEQHQVDFEWYLTNQILPPISRLCEPIEGTSPAALSQCLGLDTSKYIRTVTDDDMVDNDWGYIPQYKVSACCYQRIFIYVSYKML